MGNELVTMGGPMVVAPQQMSMTDIERVALAIAKGGLFGSKDPNAVLTLCLLAYAEGQHPAVVFRDYHVIQGKPAKKADAMLRDFINSGGKVKWHALDDNSADATFTHPSGEARIEWTIERAKTAGIANPMWKKYPRQMLRSRVISEGVRTVYPGATSGLYEENEVHDIVAESPLDAAIADTEPPAKPRNWGGRYPTKTKLHAALATLDAEMRACDDMDQFEAFLTTPEYQDFIKIAGEKAPHYLSGGEPAPPEFVGLFQLEQQIRDGLAANDDMRESTVVAG